MCETLKRIKLLDVKLWKDGLQIPVKISFGKCCEWCERFPKSVKNVNIWPSQVNGRSYIFYRETCNFTPHDLS